MKLFLSLFFILFTTNTFAAITLSTNVSGASNYDFVISNSNSEEELAPIIYGGLAGPDCAGADNTSTCNNCESITSVSSDMSCNENRIYNNLNLTIYFTSNSTSGFPAASVADADNTQISPDSSSGNTASGSQAFITLNWNSICNATAGTDCSAISGVVYKTINIGISTTNDQAIDSGDDSIKIKFVIAKPTVGNIDDCNTNNATGICSLVVFPGDQKVYIEQLEFATDSFPTVDTTVGILNYQNARIMYGTDAGSALPSGDRTDLNLLDGGTDVSPDLVDGLTNGQVYHFRFGSVDFAGNLSNISNNTQTAEPSKTAGLLADDINCFIATAAFGSTLDQRLGTLRTFRNQYLLNSNLGRKFVKLYYNFSPKVAEKIYQSKTLKLLAQAFVWPAVFWVEAGMKYGFLFVNLLLIAAFALPTILYVRRRQKC